MNRVLVTGGSGFVGSHLVEHCVNQGDDVTSLSLDGGGPCGNERLEGDLRDLPTAERVVRRTRPERVYHLAALSSTADSWRAPVRSIDGNFASTLNVLDAARREAPGARVLVVSSGAIYGRPERQPVTEDAAVAPQTPYAAGKAACDLLAAFYADVYGMDVVRMRAFNHAGPGQSAEYVVSALARQIVAAERARLDLAEVRSGDLRPRRDFTDVRDVVRAYRLALETAPAGVYNVCSGQAVAVADILEGLAVHAGIAVQPRVDPSLLRENEVLEIRGSHERLTAATGWTPEISFETTLDDTLRWWRSTTSDAAATAT